MLPFDGLWSGGIHCMNHLACFSLPISDSEKKARENLAFRVNQGSYQIQLFWQKCLTSEVHLVPVSLSCREVEHENAS